MPQPSSCSQTRQNRTPVSTSLRACVHGSVPCCRQLSLPQKQRPAASALRYLRCNMTPPSDSSNHDRDNHPKYSVLLAAQAKALQAFKHHPTHAIELIMTGCLRCHTVILPDPTSIWCNSASSENLIRGSTRASERATSHVSASFTFGFAWCSLSDCIITVNLSAHHSFSAPAAPTAQLALGFDGSTSGGKTLSHVASTAISETRPEPSRSVR